MKMIVEFDCDADIIEVPQHVIDNRELLKQRFLKWLHSRSTKHKYRVKVNDGVRKYYTFQYRSDAFVEWLNKAILDDSEKAVIIQKYVLPDSTLEQLPTIQF